MVGEVNKLEVFEKIFENQKFRIFPKINKIYSDEMCCECMKI